MRSPQVPRPAAPTLASVEQKHLDILRDGGSGSGATAAGAEAWEQRCQRVVDPTDKRRKEKPQVAAEAAQVGG